MPFEKVDTQKVDFPALERAILKFWEDNQVFEKLRQKNHAGPRWSFLDGPITANNPMGVHHAWGRTYKDAFQRYHAMNGHALRYQNGFDCQGLWVEVEVEKDKKLKSKRDIENLIPGDRFASIAEFVRLCKERVDKFAKIQTEQSIRLGYWMDWDRDEDWRKPPDLRRSYFTMSDENNYTIWSFLKKCHGRGLIYRGYDAMPWCPRCSVGLSHMEMAEGRQLVAHRAVFVRFPLRGRPNENLLVWTTTPWTLSSNVAAAVNPQLAYVKVLHRDQVYYVARGALTARRLEEEFKRKEWVEGVPKLKTLEQIFKEKGGFEVVGELTGADMVGWTYDGPFDELPAQHHPAGYPAEIAEVVRCQKWAPDRSAQQAHRVVAWKDVGAAEGTGIVHIAPGCGKEDFLLGKEEGLPPVAPLDEYGVFRPGFGPLEGQSAIAHTTTDWILEDLQHKGLLLAVEKYPHNYPHCWRCKTELLFRLVDEWFISMSWRDEIKEVVRQARWLPEEINGQARELDWLSNMEDWMISKKRFWGLALPIWVDEATGDFEVIGSRQELQERAVEGWEAFEGHSPHRPWVDGVKIRNPKTSNLMSRIPDVGNPWLDAGIVAFSTMGYNKDREYWKKWFPADFVVEAFPGQFRNWFYALLAMSTMMENRPPFKTLLGHGQVRDQWGEEMHKSKGNAIPFEGAAECGYTIDHELRPGEPAAKPPGALSFEVIEVEQDGRKVREIEAKCPPMSADLIRWLFMRHNPALNINFGPGPAEELRAAFTLKLWNSYAFLCNYARLDGFDPAAPQVPVQERPDIDRWILSDLQKLIGVARQAFDDYRVMDFCLAAERFVDDKLSNWYIRRNRKRFWKGEQGADKQAAYQTLYTVMLTLAKLVAPVMPFLAETMYQNLVPPRASSSPRPRVRGRGVGGEGAEAGEHRTPSPQPLSPEYGGEGLSELPLSVHLCGFPQVDEKLIDADLSGDMESLLRLVSLGLAARNSAKIKVRQPLAELKVQPAGERDRRAVERFGDQLCEELNVKKIRLHDPKLGPLLTQEVRANMRTLGPKFGARLGEVQAAIAGMPAAELAAKMQTGQPFQLLCGSGPVELAPADVVVQQRAPEGWAGVADRDTQVLLDTRITEALAREGMARDVVRQVQELRKKSNLEMEDRIDLHLGTAAGALRQAIDAHRDYIAAETLTQRWLQEPPDGQAHRAQVKVEGHELTIALRRLAGRI
jgi:isoleucyl-tRNA synthetase